MRPSASDTLRSICFTLPHFFNQSPHIINILSGQFFHLAPDLVVLPFERRHLLRHAGQALVAHDALHRIQPLLDLGQLHEDRVLARRLEQLAAAEEEA